MTPNNDRGNLGNTSESLVLSIILLLILLLIPWISSGTNQGITEIINPLIALLSLIYLLKFLQDQFAYSEWLVIVLMAILYIVSHIVQAKLPGGDIVYISSLISLLYYSNCHKPLYGKHLTPSLFYWFHCTYSIILILTLKRTQVEDVIRFSFYNEDPNHSIVAWLLPSLALMNFHLTRFRSFSLMALILLMLTLFDSRMGYLTLIIYYAIRFTSRVNLPLARKIAIIIFLASFFGQYIFGILLEQIISAYDISDSNIRAISIIDQSNIGRILSFNDALTFLTDKNHLLFSGINNYLDENIIATNIPHHWFILLWMQFGLAFATVAFIIVLYSFTAMPQTLLPLMTVVSVMGGILGPYPFGAPLLITVLINLLIIDRQIAGSLGKN